MIREPRIGARAAAIAMMATALAACSTQEDASPAESVGGDVPSGSSTGAPVDVPEELARNGPPVPYVERGACPFECCVYREWEAVSPVQVFAAEGDTSTVSYVIASGQSFMAATGNVHITQPGIAIVTDTITLADASGTGTPNSLAAGDTVYVLDHMGEGVFNFWRDGARFTAEAFWAVMPLSGGGPAGELVREPVSEWWVQVVGPDGTGWIRMGREGQDIRGNDACA